MKQCFRFYFSSPKYDLAVSDVIHMTHIKHSAKPSALHARLLQNKQDGHVCGFFACLSGTTVILVIDGVVF